MCGPNNLLVLPTLSFFVGITVIRVMRVIRTNNADLDSILEGGLDQQLCQGRGFTGGQHETRKRRGFIAQFIRMRSKFVYTDQYLVQHFDKNIF